METLDPGVESARSLLEGARRVVVLTGAGISTDSGIPDFRGPQGLWTRNPEAERSATIDAYVRDPEVRRWSWRNRLETYGRRLEPNAGHHALVDLERSGRLDTIVTQNVDGLHQRAGSDPSRVVEIHGTIHEAQCLSCGHRAPMEQVLARVRAGEEDPSCTERRDGAQCGGIIKSATISFGQSLDPVTLLRAEEAATRCDLIMAVGSSLGVYPAAGLVPLAHQSGARVLIINAEPTPFDDLADVVLNGSISELLPALTRA
jgi:NAD-dependent deacetylase